MRYLLTLFTIGCVILSGALGLVAVAPDAAILRFDPFHPATLVPVMAAGLHEVHTLIRAWLDTTVEGFRDVLQRTKLREALPQ